LKENDDFTLSLKGIPLKKCCSAKYLGVVIDENLTWKPHVQYLQKKLSCAVGIIGRLRYYLNHKNLIAMYYAFFYPYILYGVIGWGCASKSTLKPIQILQNKVLRIINKSTWRDHIENNVLYEKYRVLKINDLHKLEVGKFMYHCNMNTQPEIFQQYFLTLDKVHNYNTRSKVNKNYYLSSVRTDDGKSSIKFCGAQIWNKIPLALKTCSFYRFKKEYKKILLKNYSC